MHRPEQKDNNPVDGPVSSRAGLAVGLEHPTGLALLAQTNRLGSARCSWPALRRPAQQAQAIGDRRLDGTDLLCPVTLTPQAQRFSSTAVYPTMRGQTLSCLSTLAARGLRDTLLPR